MAARNGHNLLEEALRIAQATSRSHPERISGLLRLAADAFGLSSATLYLPENNPGFLTQRYSTLLPHSDSACHIPLGSGCAGSAALNRTRTTRTAELLHRDEPHSPDENQIHALPLLDGSRLVAVLSVGCASAPLTPATLRGLRPLFPVFSIAASAAAAARTAEFNRRNLSIMTALGRLLNAPLEPGMLLPRLLKLCTGTGLAVCAVARLHAEEKGKPRIFRSCRSVARGALPALLQQEQLLSQALLPGREGCGSPIESTTAYHAFCTPLGCNGRILGSCTFFGGAELTAPEQVEFLETLARLLSGALCEAISSERIESFTLENDKKLKELSLLYRMSNTMLSTIKLNKLIHLTLTALTSGSSRFFDRAMLFLANERSGVLQGMLGVTCLHAPLLNAPKTGGNDLLSSRWDISEEDMAAQRASEFSKQVQGKRLELDATLNIASQAVLEKRLIYVPDEARDAAGDLLSGQAVAFAASPLIAHGKAVGAVLVDNALTRKPITQEDLRFLQLFTNQAGMAIENSILYNKVEDANRQLCEAQESLLQKERLAAIGEMAAGIAHELKGPLVSIGGFANRLTKKLPQETDERAHADLIVREVLRLESILSEILLFSKKATICYSHCNIAQIIKDSLAVIAPALEEKQIEVKTRFTRQKLELLGDGQQLKQVFINILMNSLDAMSAGGKLTVQASFDALDAREAVCVRITDTGGGIPVEALSSIFTPFYTTKEGGTGLGLPIANRIVTNHGGKIQVLNKPGHGAEFRILVPRHLDFSL